MSVFSAFDDLAEDAVLHNKLRELQFWQLRRTLRVMRVGHPAQDRQNSTHVLREQIAVLFPPLPAKC